MPRDHRRTKTLIGAAGIGAALLIYLSIHIYLPPAFNPKPHEAAGRALAEAALGSLNGGSITVITRDTATFKNPAADVQMASFKQTLSRARVSVASIHTLQVDPLRPVEVPAGDFYELIRNSPPGSVIVSLMGPPLLTEPQRIALGKIRPGIVAFCSGNLPDRVDLQVLFGQGLLKAAIVSRPNPLPRASKPKDFRGWFDQSFVAVTSTNLEALVRREVSSP